MKKTKNKQMEPSPWMGPPGNMSGIQKLQFSLAKKTKQKQKQMEYKWSPVPGFVFILLLLLFFCFLLFCEGKLQFLDSGHVPWGTHPGTGSICFFFSFLKFFFC